MGALVRAVLIGRQPVNCSRRCIGVFFKDATGTYPKILASAAAPGRRAPQAVSVLHHVQMIYQLQVLGNVPLYQPQVWAL